MSLGYETDITLAGYKISNNNLVDKIFLILDLISSAIFIYGIYILRKLIELFISSDIFSTEVIQKLNQIGKVFLLSTLTELIAASLIFIPLGYNQKPIDHSWINFEFPTLGLALFFMFLSEVFKKAKETKDENDLTV
ncbi:DUF2975 domain-containing protein [Flavobacterium rhamnosiphilum]|uniref:DUF2975 domain-containing protein n=1 Tax=Flavobacterium rhamnosiphilum TaxID=2541724 RepID=UPI001404BA49|nr:DUF2975 domain-containing protein [Flavobacterium rhamnosiphilum]